jgi:hypothetical protein
MKFIAPTEDQILEAADRCLADYFRPHPRYPGVYVGGTWARGERQYAYANIWTDDWEQLNENGYLTQKFGWVDEDPDQEADEHIFKLLARTRHASREAYLTLRDSLALEGCEDDEPEEAAATLPLNTGVPTDEWSQHGFTAYCAGNVRYERNGRQQRKVATIFIENGKVVRVAIGQNRFKSDTIWHVNAVAGTLFRVSNGRQVTLGEILSFRSHGAPLNW